uniref:ZP domain-containing protein n=1 Tax=Sipha flava TaxID=143950 RepID=A0A2S2QF31_9HEMI
MTRHWMTSLLIIAQIYNAVLGVDLYDRALFVKSDDIRKAREIHTKVSQIAPNSMDQTVDHILTWLQSRYQNTQNQRLARQDNAQQRPRPFEATQPQEFRGYLPPQPPPQPEFSVPTSSQFPQAPEAAPPAVDNIFQTTTSDQTPQSQQPPQQSQQPLQQSQQLSQQPQQPLQQSQLPSQQPQQPQQPSLSPTIAPENFQASVTGSENQPTDFSSQMQQTTVGFTDESTGFLVTNPPFEPNSENLQSNLDTVSHPPHIHNINVQCSKEMMTINVEFNKPYDGVIYSKGFYNSQECRYVNPNSGQTKYSFKVMLNSCGTHFVDEFSTGKQAYLENVLVVQNEPGIQEAWDVIRTVRCLWEGNLNKALSIALNIGMLNQEVVTFSGDTATARLDIQSGKGPFAPPANGLVKIGETMTLVVTVDGDPGFNVLVRECVARDSNPESGNQLQLTDSQGCVAKPKLFGSFQTTTNPATGSLIAYAYFQVRNIYRFDVGFFIASFILCPRRLSSSRTSWTC